MMWPRNHQEAHAKSRILKRLDIDPDCSSYSKVVSSYMVDIAFGSRLRSLVHLILTYENCIGSDVSGGKSCIIQQPTLFVTSMLHILPSDLLRILVHFSMACVYVYLTIYACMERKKKKKKENMKYAWV